jgi:multidrug efflux pump subunit AcrA (membrane-fusion protein)
VGRDTETTNNLRSDLSALKTDRASDSHRVRRGLFGTILFFVVAAALVLYLVRGRISAQEVAIVRPTVRRSTATPATPILSASGYLVARRKAVVSAKIQGRLAELDVDEGSWVTAGQVIARLDNADLQAQIEVARAGVQQATADLAEKQRQMLLTQGLANDGVVSQDQLQASMSRARVAEAALSQSKAGSCSAKSSASTAYSSDGSFVSQELPIDHARHYALDMREPVLVVHADRVHRYAPQLDRQLVLLLGKGETKSVTFRGRNS